jgi:hypothetical protein
VGHRGIFRRAVAPRERLFLASSTFQDKSSHSAQAAVCVPNSACLESHHGWRCFKATGGVWCFLSHSWTTLIHSRLSSASSLPNICWLFGRLSRNCPAVRTVLEMAFYICQAARTNFDFAKRSTRNLFQCVVRPPSTIPSPTRLSAGKGFSAANAVSLAAEPR